MKHYAAIGVLVLLSTAAPGGQQPTFRTQVELVQVDAVVTDTSGNPVAGLTADDFEIRENGRVQSIAAFTTVDIPIERAERALFTPAAVEPDVVGNQRGAGRVYLIAFDAVEPLMALRTRRFLRTFLERHFSANDVAAIAYLSYGANNSQEFTSNRRVLLNAVDRFTGEIPNDAAPPPVTNPDAAPAPTSLSPTNQDMAARADMRSRMRAFRDVVEFLEKVPGQRKALLYISTGVGGGELINAIDYQGGVMSIEGADAHAAMRAAARGSIAIYPIDPRGLTSDGGDGSLEAAEEPDARSRRTGTNLAAASNLRMLAEATGGFAFTGQNTYEQAFTRLVRENSSYYAIGFYSTNDRRDGRFRRLDVRVKRPGLQVRARNGYVAPRGAEPPRADPPPSKNLSAAVSAALASPVASGAVPLKMFAAPYKGSGSNASVAIALHVDVAALDLSESAGRFTGELEVAHASIGRNGKLTGGEFHQAKLSLTPETMDRMRKAGLQVLSEISLPPGRHQIRTSVGNRASKAGSVVYDIDIPDFSAGELTMSGVSLSSTSVTRATTIVAKDPLRDFLPGPPATAREFSAGDTLTLFAEVYDNVKSAAAHTVTLTASIRADDGRTVQTVSEERSSSELRGSAGGYGFTPELTLDGLASGLYVIRVEATLNTGRRPSVSRDVQIRIN